MSSSLKCHAAAGNPGRARLSLLSRTVSILCILVFVYFFCKSAVNVFARADLLSVLTNPWIYAGVFCFSGAVFVSGLLWGLLLRSFSSGKVPLKEAVVIHIRSWLLKYIPGQAGSFLSKLAWGMTSGFSKTDITITFAYENIFLVSSSLLLSVPLLSLFFSETLNAYRIYIGILALGLLVFFFGAERFLTLMNKLLQALGRNGIPPVFFLSPPQLVSYSLAYLAPRIINGIGFVVIVGSLHEVGAMQIPALVAVYTLAGVIGLLAFFVPSGLGVRESVIVLFLSVSIPVETAMAAAVLARMCTVLSDGLLAAFYAGHKGVATS